MFVSCQKCWIETLFSVNGKIKKIKIYTFPDGRKKGDALVSFTKVEAVALACLQVRCIALGDGPAQDMIWYDMSWCLLLMLE